MVRGSVGIPLTGIVALMVFATAAHAAPPPNDAFASPAPVSGYRTIASNVDATREAGEPTHAGVTGGASVWFRWTAPDNRRYLLHTCDSEFDTLLAIYTGSSLASLQGVAANDDTDSCGPDGEGSFVTFDAVPGRTYSIAVDGGDGEEGTVELVLAGWDPQLNDDFADATPINDRFGPWQQFSTVSASREPGEPQHAGVPGGRSLWYSWQPSEPGPASVWICPADFESLLAVYTGDSISQLTEVASSDRLPGCRGGSRVDFVAEVGETYRIAIDGEAGQSGQGGMAVAGQQRRPLQVVVPDVAAIESEQGPMPVTMTATLDRASTEAVTVTYSTRADTAEDADYDETSGRLVFAPGETVKQFTVVTYPDADEYDDERIWVNLQTQSLEVAVWRGYSMIQVYDRDVAANQLCNRLICLRPGLGPLRAHSSGASSELRKTIPITRGGRGEVVMRLGPNKLRGFDEGDSIEASAEVEVSTTCVDRSRRCVGSRYGYSPKVKGKLVLGRGASGPRGQKVARTERLVCSQKRPNRNHHCVLVFEGERERSTGACSDCHLKLVLAASNRKAGRGDKLVIGADGTRGIEQGKGRINATVIEPDAPAPDVIRTRKPIERSIPVSARGGANNPRRVVYAARLDGLEEWEQIAVDAKTKVRTGHLPYTTFVGAHLVLSRSRQTPHLGQVEASSVTYGGEFSEKNGFNCTRGRSAHASPCKIRKVGVVRMRKPANRPLWVHLVVEASAAYGGRWHEGDVAKILRGELRVRRYGQGAWTSVVPRG